MTPENFQYSMKYADTQGHIDVDDVAALKCLKCVDEISDFDLEPFDKRGQVLKIMSEYTFIIFYDKYGNGFSRILI